MGTVKPEEIRVFIASPGDLAGERRVFKDTIDSLNGGFGEGARVRFVPLGWEDVLAETGRRAQTVINQDVDRCHLFILALHRRWGQSAPDSKFSSYTEEEFERAFNRWQKTNSPKVYIFFKNVDAASLADQGPELTKVMTFKKKLENERHVIYRPFNTETDFGKEIERHLKAFASGEPKTLSQDSREIYLPKAKAVDLSLVKANQEELTLARAAVEAADQGRIEDARILFAKATEGTTNPSILELAAEFFRQLWDLENASRLVQRQAAITQDRMVAAQHFLALVPSGLVTEVREQFEEKMLDGVKPEFADLVRSVGDEIYGGERYKDLLLDLYVKHFSTAELMEFSRFLTTAEGQSSLQKQKYLVADLMNVISKKVERAVENRGFRAEDMEKKSLKAAPAILQEPKQLTGDVGGS